MQNLTHTIIPGKSVILAHINPMKMNKRMFRSFIEDKNILQPLLEKYFQSTSLGQHFTVENIYDAFPQENKERWLLHVVADIDISTDNFQQCGPEAMLALKNLIDEMLPNLPGEFHETIYEDLMQHTKH